MGPLRDHYDLITSYYRRLAAAVCLALFAVGCSAGGQGGDVDLSTAIPLLAVPAPTPSQFKPGEGPGSPAIGQPDNVPISNLFSLPPGQFASMASMAGVIDPVGTALPQDFDGDGILNDNETASNRWTADYPVVQAKIATPVTLKIEILQSTTQTNDEITSEITSNDFEDTVNRGTEQSHRNEINERTTQFQDSISSSSSLSLGQKISNSSSYGINLSGGALFGLIEGSYGFSHSQSNSKENSWSNSQAYAETRTKWADVPFKNNLNRNAWQVKSDSAARKARKFRSELRQKIDETSVVEPNAGYVRAALYIENLSVNMPVRLSNILCSLMFETPDGTLIPVQSFFLRNEDYSPFSVDVYGGTQFGPYVIELANLNTAEIKNAIAGGYNPRIFIADYDMEHVPDSNYRSALLNYSGDNLKIVEENAKGRTGLVRIIGPGIREAFRVAAFDTNGTDPDICKGDAGTMAAPGISLEKALERISCSGMGVQFEDYVVDMSGDGFPNLAQPRFHIRGVRSVGSFSTTLPCTEQTHTGSDGVSRTACVQKPLSEWTDAEKLNSGIWVVFADGRYYAHTEYIRDGGNIRTFNTPGPGEAEIPMVRGIDSMMWVGDTFDIVFLSYKELEEVQVYYGTNPLETGEIFTADTLWDSSTISADAFDPDANSKYLGTVGFGEEIEIAFRLSETQYLNPNFGVPTAGGGQSVYTDFSYDPTVVSDRFSMREVADFEISLGFGGERTDWLHITKDLDNTNAQKPDSCGDTLDYVNQVFYKCIKLPTAHPTVDPAISVIHVYLRPALSNGYRNAVWPLHYADVRRFRALARNAYETGDTVVELDSSIGQVIVGDSLRFEGDTVPYTIDTVSESEGVYTVTLSTGLGQDLPNQTLAYVLANLTAPVVEFVMDDTFLADWNLAGLDPPDAANWRNAEKADLLTAGSHNCSLEDFNPVLCLGFATDYIAGNWVGNNNFGVPNWNAWADAGDFFGFLDNGLPAILSGGGSSMAFRTTPDDKLVSSATSGDQRHVKVVSYGNTMFAVWHDVTTGGLRGRLQDSVTGEVLGAGDFAVSQSTTVRSLTNSGHNPNFAVAASDSVARAAVVWVNTDSSVGVRAIDLSAGAPVGSDLVFGGLSNVWDIKVTVVGSRALVVRTGLPVSPGQLKIMGQFVDLTTVAAEGPAIQISQFTSSPYPGSTLDGGAVEPEVAVGVNGRAIVVWRQTYCQNGSCDTERRDIHGRLVDMNTAQLIGNEFPILTGSNDSSGAPEVAARGNTAVIIWPYSFGASKPVLGRVLDLSTGGMLPSADLTTNNNNVYRTSIAVGQRYALAVIEDTTAGSIIGRVIDTQTGFALGASSFAISSANTNTQSFPQVAAHGDRAIAVWQSDHLGTFDIRGALIDMPVQTVLSPGDFAVSASNFDAQDVPAISLSGTRGLVAWNSRDNTTDYDIRSRVVDTEQLFTTPYGLNNFFTSPLIRRQYEVQALIKLDP